MSAPWWYPDPSKVSACCSAPILGEISDGFGRCSQCKEMSPVENIEDTDDTEE